MNHAPEVESLFTAQSELDICKSIAVACHELGFRWGNGFGATPDEGGDWVFRRFGAFPKEFPLAYLQGPDVRLDPVMQYVKHSALPLVWNKATYERVGRVAMWEIQAPYGLANGIAAALHMPDGRGFMLGFDGDDDFGQDPRERAAIVGRFQIFHAHLEAAFSRIMGWPHSKAKRGSSQLTARELECLRWSAEGKTLWEIGQLLNISERTVKKHVESTVIALDCVSKTHAVARAIRLQLI
jgi:DNA-binding CsgD family transcriptional regulator